MNSHSIAKHGLSSLLYTGLLSLSSLAKFSFVIGSWHMFFSALNCFGPLAGSFWGLSGSFMVYGLRTMLRLVTVGLTGAQMLNGVPTLCASLYLGSSHWSIRCILPIICMIVFWLHPVGLAAGVYALYWLIPVVIFYSKSNHLFVNALGSTFVAHGVGSVIWLYTVPMEPATWLALIPIVAVERLLFATGMVIAHGAIQAAAKRVSVVAQLKRIFTIA